MTLAKTEMPQQLAFTSYFADPADLEAFELATEVPEDECGRKLVDKFILGHLETWEYLDHPTLTLAISANNFTIRQLINSMDITKTFCKNHAILTASLRHWLEIIQPVPENGFHESADVSELADLIALEIRKWAPEIYHHVAKKYQENAQYKEPPAAI